ncbi:putative small s protein [Diaporthe ampelina]|uniref:Putative small s protein n=1 Tax=Diaporthe ampelina TaxID=1214573 RepID=A0A0G2IGL2_9PEZI|nr:putative small s protein [Diaporthe ampelina]
MRQFDQRTRMLIEATMKDSGTLRLELNDRVETVNKKLKEARQQLERQHREAMSLAIHHHLEQMSAVKNLSDERWQVKEAINSSIVTRKILNALWFSTMSDRFDDIKPAHQETFEWVFTKPVERELANCTFMDWMEGDNGIYWACLYRRPASLCLIDGLDEYEASEEKHFELSKILKEAAGSSNFKIVVSSRPETPFEVTFGNCDKMRLHELTRNDRKVYVADVLNRHWRIRFLVDQADDGEQAKDGLIDCAVEMSGGIFLWLKLVAAALVEELNTCDTFADLQAVLEQFPRGLEELYRHMLQRIPEQRRIKGAQIIQLVRCSMAVSEMKAQWISKISPPPPMSAHALSVAHTNYTNIVNRNRKALRPEESEDAIRKVDYLLRSHCAGLLELKDYEEMARADADAAAEREIQDPEVVFLHKSVIDFIDHPDAQPQLLSSHRGIVINNGKLSIA